VHLRRLILLFLLVLLPLQWGWAAAARACQHEAEGWHFGHHQHQHPYLPVADMDAAAASAQDAGGDDCVYEDSADAPSSPTSSLQEHPDCPSCHGLGVVCVTTAPPLWPQALAAAPPRGPLPWPARVRADGVLRPPQIFLA